MASKTSKLELRIRETVAAIPPGKVASYGQIAELAGWPRRARFVSRALGRAPRSLGLPWFRVLRTDGRIAFPPGSESFKRQKDRLIADGVVVIGGRVDMREFRWSPDLDELLFQPPLSEHDPE